MDQPAESEDERRAVGAGVGARYDVTGCQGDGSRWRAGTPSVATDAVP